MAKSDGSTPRAPKAAKAAANPLRKVPFTARLDGAREVLLTGDFTNWSGGALALSPRSDGAWSATLQLAPGEYQYRLLVDGQWRDHAEAQRRVPNPYGSENCVLTVS